MGKVKRFVSVIIPTHKGAEAQTKRLIESLRSSLYQSIEIVVVNENKERSAQRNIGIAEAKGEFLFLPDSDWVVDPWLISECVSLMTRCDAVYIPETIKTKGFFSKVRNWERQFYNGTCIDVVRFLKADKCPQFDESMSGPEDTDWDRRVEGERLTCQTDYSHYDNVGLLSYFRKKAYYAKSMKAFRDKHPNDKILDWKWRCFKVFFENGKWRKVVRKPHYMIMVWLILFIRGVIYKWEAR